MIAGWDWIKRQNPLIELQRVLKIIILIWTLIWNTANQEFKTEISIQLSYGYFFTYRSYNEKYTNGLNVVSTETSKTKIWAHGQIGHGKIPFHKLTAVWYTADFVIGNH